MIQIEILLINVHSSHIKIYKYIILIYFVPWFSTPLLILYKINDGSPIKEKYMRTNFYITKYL